MPSKKKRSGFQKFFLFLGKSIAWIVVGLAKAVFYVFKGVYLGIAVLSKKSARKVSEVKQERRVRKSQPKGDAVFEGFGLVRGKSGSFDDFQSRLDDESLIIAVAGRRGSGKSVLGFRILENIHANTSRPCFALGVKQSVIPEWISSIDSLDDVDNNGIVLVDEGAVSFGSRNSMSAKNKELGKLLAVARHKDLTLIFITQNTGMIDKNVLNLCDTIILKEGSLLQEKMERSVMKDMYRTANEELKKIDSKDRKSHCYVFDSDFEGLLKVSLPSFWSSKVSKNQA